MTGKQAIIDKIMSQATTKGQQIVSEAQQQAALSLDEAKARINAKQLEIKAAAQANANELIERKMTVTELDAKKYQLSCKQQLLSQVFTQAEKQISDLNKQEYLKIISKLISTYAEHGETVTICSADKGVITKEYLDGFKLDLKLNTQFGNFNKGIVLSKGSYDKNLSLSVLMSIAREENEAQVAKLLFD